MTNSCQHQPSEVSLARSVSLQVTGEVTNRVSNRKPSTRPRRAKSSTPREATSNSRTRNIRPASTRILQLDRLQNSEGSLNFSDLDNDGELLSSPNNSSSTGIGKHVGRRAELRNEMKEKLTKRSPEGSPKEPHRHSSSASIVLTRTPLPRKKSTPVISTASVLSNSADALQKKKAGKSSPKSSSKQSSSPSATTGKGTKQSKIRRGHSMRHTQRNKQKLEREQHHDSTPSGSKDNSELGVSDHRASGMSLNRFMVMKQQSEKTDSESEDTTGTWPVGSVDFSMSAFGESFSELVLGEGDDKKKEVPGEEHDTIIDDIGDSGSVVSLKLNDVTDHNPSKAISATKEDSGTSLTEAMESQSLSIDDLSSDEEVGGRRDRMSLRRVHDFAVVDPAGRKGIFSGMISKSSGMPCGLGRLEYPDMGEVFEGQFVHGFWTGYGRCLSLTTGEDYTGTFLQNAKHGHGTTQYRDGRVFEGTYTHGVKSEGKMTYQDGSAYLGQWANGARNGRGTYTFANGSVFFGEFVDDEIHGSGVLTWSNGSRHVGKWKKGVRHGRGQEFRPNGSLRREGVWREGSFLGTKKNAE